MSSKKRESAQDTTFVYTPDPAEVEEIRTVSLVGSFKESRRLQMTKVQDHFEITVPLSEGKHRYWFIVNGSQCKHDPNKPCIQDEDGAWINLIEVPARHGYSMRSRDPPAPPIPKYINVLEWQWRKPVMLELDSQGNLPENVLLESFKRARTLMYDEDSSWVFLQKDQGKILLPHVTGKRNENLVYYVEHYDVPNLDTILLKDYFMFWQSWQEESKCFGQSQRLEGDAAESMILALKMAQRFINTTRAKDAFVRLGADMELLTKRAQSVGFYIQTGREESANALAWIIREQPTRIYINEKFMNRLARLPETKAGEEERKIIFFAIAMAITHEFTHIAEQCQKQAIEGTDQASSSKTTSIIHSETNISKQSVATPITASKSKSIKRARGSDSASRLAEASSEPEPKRGTGASSKTTQTAVTSQEVHITPEQLNEAGRFMEKCLFQHTLRLAYKNQKPTDSEWTENSSILGVVLDSCEHDKFKCNNCEKEKRTTSECLRLRSMQNEESHEIPACDQCDATARFKYINKDYIDTVFNKPYAMPEEVLLDISNFCSTKGPGPNTKVLITKCGQVSTHITECIEDEDELVMPKPRILKMCGTR